MNPSFHEIQLDLPKDGQAAPSSSPLTSHNITVEYAERQISKRERNFLQFLSTFIYKSEFVDEIAVATLKEQNGLPRSTLHTIFWSHGIQVCHTLKLKNCVNCEKCTMPKILKCIWLIPNLSYPG